MFFAGSPLGSNSFGGLVGVNVTISVNVLSLAVSLQSANISTTVVPITEVPSATGGGYRRKKKFRTKRLRLEFNVDGVKLFIIQKVYNIIGKVLNLFEDKYNIKGQILKDFDLSLYLWSKLERKEEKNFSIKGSRKFDYKEEKICLGKREIDFNVQKNVLGIKEDKLDVELAFLKALKEFDYLDQKNVGGKVNKLYKEEKIIKGRKDISPILLSLDLLN